MEEELAQATFLRMYKPNLEIGRNIHGVVVRMMVPFWVVDVIRHLIFRVPTKGP